MGTKYSTVTVSGYNSSPPSDDGSATASNQVKWSTIKTKLPDPLKTAIEAVNTALLTYVDQGPTSLNTNYTTTATDHLKVLTASSGTTISLGDAASMAAGYIVIVKNRGSGSVTVAPVTSADTLNGTAGTSVALGAQLAEWFICTGTGYHTLTNPVILPSGAMMITAASSAPSGWLLCDGTAVSRTTYSALFTAISTAYGVGDGSTTFNVPDFRGRSVIGAGAPTFADAYTSVTFSSNQLTVTSNSTRYITGMQVTASNISGLTGIGNGTTWVIRVDATHISFASSLANAQNGTVATVTGTGNITLTFTGTTRTRGDLGGEEGHAMSSTELLSHSHTVSRSDSAASSSPDLPRGNNTNTTTISTNSTGGNAAMSVMNPFGVGNWIIKT